jgi:Autotransporter beta-domain
LIEPSGGFIWSRANIGNYNPPLVIPGLGSFFLPGILLSKVTTDPIPSEIGRLSLRVGTTLTSGNIVLQPFASASVYNEFASNVTTSLASQPGLLTFSSTNSTTRVGAYGQYSLGLAAQVANTGWLGFVRGDYRKGDNIEGLERQCRPPLSVLAKTDRFVVPMPTKAPVKAVGAVIPVTNWTGFYAGGVLGAAYGKTDIRFVGDPNNEGTNPRAAGFLGGGEIAYNYQFANNWVLGVEGDLAGANLQGSKTCGLSNGRDATGFLPTPTFTPADFNCENAANWMATVAARVGYSWNRTLFYAKAGGAWADDSVNANCIFGPNSGLGGTLFASCFIKPPSCQPTASAQAVIAAAGW